MREVRVGEALVFRRTRRANTVPPTVLDLTSTAVESDVPATHPFFCTDVDETESAASSGTGSRCRHSRPGNDDESASCQTGHPRFMRSVIQTKRRPSPILPPQSFSWEHKLMIDLVEVWKFAGIS